MDEKIINNKEGRKVEKKVIVKCPHCGGKISELKESGSIKLRIKRDDGRTEVLSIDLKNLSRFASNSTKFFCPFPGCGRPLSRSNGEHCSCGALMLTLNFVWEIKICSDRNCVVLNNKADFPFVSLWPFPGC